MKPRRAWHRGESSRRSLLLCLAAGAALSTGCLVSYSAPRSTAHEDAIAKEFEPSLDEATLYIFVDRYSGGLFSSGAVDVLIDSVRLGQLSAGTYQVVRVPPGRHTIRSGRANDTGIRIQADAGEIHFVGFYDGWDGFSFGWVDPGRARIKIMDLQLARLPAALERNLAGRSIERTYSEGYSRMVAVVIGINEYDAWGSLEGAVADGTRIAKTLRGFGFETVTELYDEAASRQQILMQLGHTLTSYTDADSLVLVYFAGHGQTEELRNHQRRGYIVPADGDPRDPFTTAISMETLRSISSRLEAKHVLFVMDSCYSGLGLVRGIRASRELRFPADARSERAIQMITAGTQGQQALEVNGVGLFTDVFAEALRGSADLNGDGFLTATEIGEFVEANVSARSQRRQTPRFGTLEGSGEIVFDLH